MIKIVDKSKCCGCLACMNVCPQKCITYKEDKVGFIFPIVDEQKCIKCGKCHKVCPIENYKNENKYGLEAYVAFSKEEDIRKNGSSGGMFETFAQQIIKENGVVFSSKFDENLKLRCFKAENKSEVKQLCKSKYLQSYVAGEFDNIKAELKNGKDVLFCGTPCQVSALKNYLVKVNTDKLILVDFFCHGVPSQNLFDRCLEYLENKKKIKIQKFEFRTKIKNGVTPHYYTYVYKNKKGQIKQQIGLYLKNPFYLGFQKYITLRDSCYDCFFGKGNHKSDITIGDFHEIDKYIKGINRFDGVSTVILNTEKGINLWNKVKGQLELYSISLEKLLNDKVIYSEGTKSTKERDEFIRDIETKNFEEVVKKWFNTKKEWKKVLYYKLPNKFKKIIKNYYKG